MIILKLDSKGAQELTVAIHEICAKYGIDKHPIHSVVYNKFPTIKLKNETKPPSPQPK